MRSYIERGMQKMNRRDLPRFVELKKEIDEVKREKNSFFELLDVMDFRDDLNYK